MVLGPSQEDAEEESEVNYPPPIGRISRRKRVGERASLLSSAAMDCDCRSVSMFNSHGRRESASNDIFIVGMRND